MNWKEEKEKLEQRASWFDPQINSSHEIEILEEVDLSHYFEMEYKGQVRKKLRLPIKTGGKELNWGIGLAKTKQSLYGQLVYLFDHWASENKPMKGQVIHLEVKAEDELADKKKRRFRITEAVELIKATPETDKAKDSFVPRGVETPENQSGL